MKAGKRETKTREELRKKKKMKLESEEKVGKARHED